MVWVWGVTVTVGIGFTTTVMLTGDPTQETEDGVTV